MMYVVLLVCHKRKKPGDVLLSHNVLQSALECLTSVFGMGTGVSTSPSSPGFLSKLDLLYCLQS